MGFYDTYPDLRLTDQQILEEAYRKYIGEGKYWEERGQLQSQFLQFYGLSPGHRLLDVGCGPLRGGSWFIDYLDAGNYTGIDQNADLLVAAQHVINERDLGRKVPSLVEMREFHFDRLGQFDYILAWSVLNHCPIPLRELFFKRVGLSLAAEGRLIITHGSCFDDCRWLFDVGNLRCTRRLTYPFPEFAEPLLEPIYEFRHELKVI